MEVENLEEKESLFKNNYIFHIGIYQLHSHTLSHMIFMTSCDIRKEDGAIPI